MSEEQKKPTLQPLTRQRQMREAAALRANLLKRKNQSRLRETANNAPEQPNVAVVKDPA